jgi:Viral coat protein P2 N-terminal domain
MPMNLDDNAGPRNRPTIDRRLMPQIVGAVQANAKPYLQLPVGYRYHGILFDFAATTLAATSVTTDILVNGKAIQHFTWDQRDAWNQHDKLQAFIANTGQMYIPFERVGLVDYRERYLTCINTGANSQGLQSPGGITDLRVNLAFDGNPVGVTKFDCYAFVSGCNPEQSCYLNYIDQWQENMASSAAGTDQVFQRRLTVSGDETHQFVHRLWLNDTAAHISKLRIEENGIPVHESIPTAITNYDAQMYGVRTPQTNWQFWDGGMRGEGDRMIDAFNDATLKVVATGITGVANPLTVVTETLGPSAT